MAYPHRPAITTNIDTTSGKGVVCVYAVSTPPGIDIVAWAHTKVIIDVCLTAMIYRGCFSRGRIEDIVFNGNVEAAD